MLPISDTHSTGSLAARRSAKSQNTKRLIVSTQHNLSPLNINTQRIHTLRGSPQSQHAPFSASVITTCPDLLPPKSRTNYTQPLTAVPIDTDINSYLNDSEEQYYKDGPALILPNLYLGSMHVVADKDLIKMNDIKFVLNVAKEVENPYLSSSHSMLAIDSALPASYTTDMDSDPEEETQIWSPSGKWNVDSSSATRNTPLATSASEEGLPLSPAYEKPNNCLRRKLSFLPPTYMKLSWGHNHETLIEDFEAAFTYIDQARRDKVSVLVACQQGISRSASLIVAYVMKTLGLSLAEAYAFVKNRSPHISPNVSLIGQLAEFESMLQERKDAEDGITY